ncbi:MAG: hypothetical protein HY303_03420 [Candidatus Wallbacteria bacterium]|nr:hypothetical protein [Candidatus Wallbacteria bacterium]
MVDECFREGLAALAGSDARFGLEYATWLAELTFQNPPASALFSTPLASVALAMEANRWKGWIKDHPSQNRLEWFRQAIDRAIETLQNPDAPVAWPGLSALSELLPLPASEPYLFRAAWVREPLAERAQLARVYQDWWSAHRVTFTPLGKKYW